jgi:hypothetical protein
VAFRVKLGDCGFEGGCVIRISVPYVYNVSESLSPLSSLSGGENVSEHLYVLYNAHSTLSNFLFRSVWSSCLRVCKGPGNELLASIKAILDKDGSSPIIDFWEAVQITQKLTAFKTVLEAEFQTAATYLVTGRRGYDIATLIETGEVIFPDELMRKVPAVQFDLREAGKCIAFNLGTAAGFHLLRALELVIQAYWNVVMDSAPLPENRNIGAYIREMENGGKNDPKVLVALKQIKNHHRNSLMHPEETLDLDAAIALLGIVQSAAIAMLNSIPEPPPAEEPLMASPIGEMLLPAGDIEIA